MKPILLLLSIIAIAVSILLYIEHRQSAKEFGGSVVDALSDVEETDGFARATNERKFSFPADHGPHEEFQTEWWYYTGNLLDENGRHFGFQLTFFRRALRADTEKRKSGWASNQVYFAHFAVTDTEDKKFYPSEKWSRSALGLSGANAQPFRVWVGDWSAMGHDEIVRLRARNDSASIDLKLSPSKPIILHGDNGLSRKSAEPGNASYYYSQTRLATSGFITIANRKFRVKGLSWLDREWGTSSLSKEQSGWDWFSLQLTDNREIMLYQIRLKSGGIDSYSSGSLIERDGNVRHLRADDFSIETLDKWKSPTTGAIYPSRWRINIPRYGIAITVIPYLNGQELPLTFAYWEGTVKFEGSNVSGNGYVELTGYVPLPPSDKVSNSAPWTR